MCPPFNVAETQFTWIRSLLIKEKEVEEETFRLMVIDLKLMDFTLIDFRLMEWKE